MKTLKKLHPNITDCKSSIEFLTLASELRFYYINKQNKNYDIFVLSNIRLKLSLIKNENDDGVIRRLIVNDEGCKTVYGISPREFEKILSEMKSIANGHNLILKILFSKNDDINSLIKIVQSYGFKRYIIDQLISSK